ncbi:MAG: hypothetical protein A3H97_14070 [Acidobacteria bacterium RIFCSPLOWO2_02_FULL_65_29]|nr:MAG: hypothetical protein A3H97_14070 [Acidobacteria bacterium RIFCSPLOWO2_02_FULL_65_29]
MNAPRDETVQLVLNRLGSTLGGREFLAHGRFPCLPDPQNGFLESPQVAWRWLQQGEFVCRTVLRVWPSSQQDLRRCRAAISSQRSAA